MIIGEEYKPFNLFFGAVMPNWLMKRTEINGNDKMIFSRLCQYAGKNGKAFPKRETLAEEVGLKENTVRKILIKLEDNGLIKIKPKKNGVPTEYIFTWHKWINTGFKDADLKMGMENGDNHPRNKEEMGITIPENHENGDNHPQNKGCKTSSRQTGKGFEANEEAPKRINSLRESTEQENPDLTKKPCDKYNYEYVGDMKDSSSYFEKLAQTKKSFIAMLERDYGRPVQTTYKDNLLGGKNEKFFKSLTTFLLVWDKQTPNRVQTYRGLVKSYYRNVFFESDETSKHKYYWEKAPNPNQLITENGIEIWEQFWVDNPMLQLKSKKVSNEVKIQQAVEKKKFKWYLEEIKRHIFDNCHELFTGTPEQRNEYFDLKEIRDEIVIFRKESGVK